MQTHHILEMAKAISRHLRSEYGLPVEAAAIIPPLEGYWAGFAVHIWSVEDVIAQSHVNGWPMCEADALEILQDIERDVDSEHGITWQSLSDALDAWGESVRWAELDAASMRAFIGHFIVEAGEHRVPVDGTLLDAVERARALANCAEASVISIPSALVGIPGAEEEGRVLLTLHPEESHV